MLHCMSVENLERHDFVIIARLYLRVHKYFIYDTLRI